METYSKPMNCLRENLFEKHDIQVGKIRRKPDFIQIEPTTYCNLDCRFCNRKYIKRINQHFNIDLLKSIVKSNKKLKSISFVGIGEPLLNPMLFQMIALCKSKGIRTSINTNGSLLSNNAKKLAASGLERLQVSFDASTQQTLQKLKSRLSLNDIIEGVNKAAEVAFESKMDITFHTTLSDFNIRELPAIVTLAAKLKINEITTEGIHHWDNRYDNNKHSIYNMNQESVKMIFKEACDEAKKNRITLKIIPVERIGNYKKPENYHCPWPWDSCFITVEGDVTPCCICIDPNLAKLGNLADTSFEKIWNSFEYQVFRNSFINGTRKKFCLNCHYLLTYGEEI